MKCLSSKIIVLLLLAVGLYSCKKQADDTGNAAGIVARDLNSEADLDLLRNEIGDARIVLLGEATHGTSEFYKWRAAITKRLVQEKGFTAIGVEGEWADSYRVNQFIQGPAKDSLQAVELLRQYDRWPTWMWGNTEIASLATWLNHENQGRAPAQKVGFYGLDVYCLWESAQELLPYVQSNDSLRRLAMQVYDCFHPFSADPQLYANAVAQAGASCRAEAEGLWSSVDAYTGGATARDEASFVMQQNALVVANGERYYRTAVSSYPESWNIRNRHMAQTITRLLEKNGPQ
ncbi:MAG: protein-L-isoaspartate O-methyltransferase [Flaviaesturariibacter sp.]|nr:protein-L-isoaspartate O-methyltransferase [Flaviaesturariibacter sp.]